MGKDLFLIDTGCNLNESIPRLFKDNGYDVQVINKIRKELRYGCNIIKTNQEETNFLLIYLRLRPVLTVHKTTF